MPQREIEIVSKPHGQAVKVPSRGLIVVSWSEIDTARQCPYKHSLSYIERWSQPPRSDGALAKGTLFHLVMEAHYTALQATQGAKPGDRPTESDVDRLKAAKLAAAKVLHEAERAGQNDPGALETVALVAWLYDGYIAQWGISPDWWIASTEHNAQVRLPNTQGKPSRFALKLKIDLVIAMRSGILADGPKWRRYCVDFKTGRNLPKEKDFDLLDQFSLYTWALNRMGKSVFGQMYDAIRTFKGVHEDTKPAPLDTRYSRTPMHRTDVELNRVAIEAFQTVQARYRQQIECDKIGAEPPRHTDAEMCGWKCVPEGTLVSGRPFGASRRRYSGPLATIETKRGRKLTVTPEHPILTAEGWIRAGLLAKGQYVVGSTRAEASAHSLVGSNVEHGPVPIEQVFDSLCDTGSLERVESRSVQLYGDHPDTEVEVVWADCVLTIELLAQPRRQLVLTGSDDRPAGSTTNGFGRDLLVERSYTNPTFGQPSFDGYSMDVILAGERSHRLSSSIVIDHGRHIEPGQLSQSVGDSSRRVGIEELRDSVGIVDRSTLILDPGDLRLRPQLDTSSGQLLTQGAEGSTVFATDGGQRPASLVEIDQIVDVHWSSYSGWVFDLSTRDGWFVADTIVTHNCGLTEACIHGRKGGDTRDFLQSAGWTQDFTRH